MKPQFIPYGDTVTDQNVEIEIGSKRRRLFLKVFFDPVKIYIDTKGLPNSAILCAMCDGERVLVSRVGKSGKQERRFLDIDWVIDKWGGPKDFIEAFKLRKEMTLKEIPRLKEKYL